MITINPFSSGTLPALVEGLPNISGWEAEIDTMPQTDNPVFLPYTNLRLKHISAGFAIALHMHQPTIPAGSQGELISNLQYMFEHPYEGDNHNAAPFAYCYARLGDFIPELVEQGCNPRIMVDYSGALLWGLQQIGRQDILGKLKLLTCDPAYQPYVEWLGTMWGHAVVPFTPIPDIKLHVQAWRHHFASLFGLEALARVKGFSPPEMHLPNHPDTLYEFVKALKDVGYYWLLAPEHTVESLTGGPLSHPHLPHRLIARNSQGETLSITILIKTQGSDAKLVAQMQPYYKAQALTKTRLGAATIPPLVSQIADGENDGVMMNEFPGAFKRAWHDIRQQGGGKCSAVGLTGTEYLELIEAAGCNPEDYLPCQPTGQYLLWQRVNPEASSSEAVEDAIAALKQEDPTFYINGPAWGPAWTNDRNWVRDYGAMLDPIQRLSAQFHQTIALVKPSTSEPLTRQHRYRNALLHNLLLQTSCFRYWGQAPWTNYAQEIYRRGQAILTADF